MTIPNAFIQNDTADLVAILDINGAQVFETASPLKATIKPEIKYMTHPVEDGGNITDHRIILPNVVAITLVLEAGNYRDTYQQIKQSAVESTPFIVQTKSDTFNNMRIAEYPSEEDPQYFDTVIVNLVFREIQFDSARIQLLPPESVADPSDASTVDRGEQQGQETENEQGSILFRTFG